MGHNKKIKDKIHSLESLKELVVQWKKENNRIVFTNGCFDIVHLGHVDYLSKAADKGNKLIVAVNTDESVRQQGKGASRPIQDETSRSYILAALECIDAVVLFGEETPQKLIATLLPDVLVKGADYKANEIVGYKKVTENGGTVELIEFLDGYSTSAIERKIKES